MKTLNKVMAILALVATPFVFGADNSVYVDQSGDNATINMTQDGASNRIRGIQGVGTGNTTPSKIFGDNVTVTVEQIGSGNILNLGVVTATASGGVDTSVVYSLTGNAAIATFNMNASGQGTANSNTINVNQTGDSAVIDVNMLGSGNILNAVTAGGDSNQIIAIIDAEQVTVTINKTGGGGNQTNLNLTGAKGTVDLTVLGASNATNITQSGGGANGHNATLNFNGSSNITNIVQSGSIDTTVNLASVGSNNTFSITTGN